VRGKKRIGRSSGKSIFLGCQGSETPLSGLCSQVIWLPFLISAQLQPACGGVKSLCMAGTNAKSSSSRLVLE